MRHVTCLVSIISRHCVFVACLVLVFCVHVTYLDILLSVTKKLFL